MRIEKRGDFDKVRDGIAYGWAVVSTINGEPYVDLHGDYIPDETLPGVAAEFMANYRVGKDMHAGEQIADVVFCLPITADIAKGLDLESNKTGLVIGWRPHDPAILAKIESGERVGFSIGGWVTDYDEATKAAVAKALDKVAKKPRRTYRSWKLGEISLVDAPAQEPALVGVVKRRAPLAIAVSKRALYTTEVDGHQHLLDLDCVDESGGGYTSHQTAAGSEYGHSHPWLRDAAGKITILADSGHTHAIADDQPAVVVVPADSIVVVANRDDDNGRKSTPPQPTPSVPVMDARDHRIAELETQLADGKRAATLIEAQLAEAKKRATLTDAQRAHFAKLVGDAAQSWLDTSPGDRDAALAAIEKANEVVYRSTSDGTEYRKNDDPRLVALAKRDDQRAEQLAKAERERESAIYKARAQAELPSLGGELEVKVAVLKALEGIPDEKVRDAALKMLRGANAAAKAESVAKGVNSGEDPREQDPLTAWNQGLAEFAKASNVANPLDATAAFLRTEKGRALKSAYDATRAYAQRPRSN